MYVQEEKGGVTHRFESVDWFYSNTSKGPTPYAVYSTDHASQYGWRGAKDNDTPDRHTARLNDRVLSGGTWGSANSDLLAVERARLATTPSPLVRTPSLPVHARVQYKTKAPGVASVWGRRQEGQRFQDYLAICDVSSGREVPGGKLASLPSDLVTELRREVEDRMAAARPTKPLAGLGQFVAELRDFPRLVQSFADISLMVSHGKKVGSGDSYLAYQFGLMPIIKDIMACAEVIQTGPEKLGQFLKDSGKLVSRSVRTPLLTLRDEPLTLPNQANYLRTPTPATQYRQRSSYVGHRTDSVSASGFGLYEYFIGDPDDALGKLNTYAKKAQKLLGTSFTPQLVWELTPWSWMIDWFVDIGGLLAFQSEVSDYSLALRRGGWNVKRTSSRLIEATFSSTAGPAMSTKLTWPITLSSNHRYAALSPFGISVSWDELSPFQLSILAALGLSRKGV